jgi:uncharacterized RDD family membrane protein YckC
MTTIEQPDPFGATLADRGAAAGPRAGFWIRFAALMLDAMVLLLPSVVTAAVSDVRTASSVWWYGGIVYFTVMEGRPRGQTLGKRICRIAVVDRRTGTRIGFGRALIRALGRWLSLFMLGVGYLWMLWDSERQTWHDKLARDVVVRVPGDPAG